MPVPPPQPAALASLIAAHTASPSTAPSQGYEYGPLAYQRQDYPTPLGQKLKVAFFWVTLIAPIRLVLFAFFFLGNWIWGYLALIGIKDPGVYKTKPLPRWRRLFFFVTTKIFTHCAMFVAGMIPGLTWTRSKVTRDMLPDNGAPKNQAEVDKWGGEGKAPICVGTHTSWVDAVTLVACNNCPSPVAAVETYNLPFISLPLRAMQTLPTNRQADGSSNVVSMINERLAGGYNPNMPEILIYPEGGTNNGTVLTQFRTGAFRAGVPIRVFAMNYPWKHFDPAWETMHLGEHILMFFGQVYNRFHYTEFPVYYPSEAEKKNPALFASNVREWMKIGLRLNYEEVNIRDKWNFLGYLLKKKTYGEYMESRMHTGEQMSPQVSPMPTPSSSRRGSEDSKGSSNSKKSENKKSK